MNTKHSDIFKSFFGTEEKTIVLALANATASQLSDAVAYEACYNWYITNQKVLPENAALASKVFIQKYALHNNDGICLEQTPEDMWKRLAATLADIEVATNKINNNKNYDYWYKKFYDTLKNFKAVPGGSVLSVLGNQYINSSASNCFVVGTEDSLEGIMKTASDMARLQSFRGGTGIDISPLRPSGSFVNNSARHSTGAYSFMDFFSKVTATIGQAGRCLKEDQKVLTMRGLIQIKDVVAGDMVWTQKGWIKNLATLYNGKKETYKITTSRGLEIVATDNHIITGSDNFSLVEKQLKDFVVGDNVVSLPGTITTYPYIRLFTDISYDKGHKALNNGNRLNEDVTYPNELTEELAYFIGYSFGDGYVERDEWNNPETLSLACAIKHPEIQNKLVSISNSLFNYSMKICKGDGLVNKVSIHSKLLTLFLETNGLLKQKHNKLIMPEVVKKSSTSVQMAFISGYFDADRYASGNKKGYVIASVCKPILKEMQSFLISAGIISYINNGETKNDSCQPLFSLSITGSLAQARAVSLLQECIKIKNKAFIAKRDTILTPFNPNSYGIKYNAYSFIADNTQHLSTNGFNKLKELGLISDELLVLDTVKSIEFMGEADVYDLKLASHHRFYCEGFNVHNSGATMISIDSHHPDVEKFIEEKQDLDKQWFFDELKNKGIDINEQKYTAIATRLKSTSKANVSVKAYDKFMEAVDKDTDYELWYEFKDNKYPKISKIVKARAIWDKLIKANVNSAEPGILFWDTILRESVSDCYAGKKIYNLIVEGSPITFEHDIRTVSTNPCSELPLPVGSACTLLSQNLTRYILNPWLDNAKFDFVSFVEDVRTSTRMLDNIKEYDISRLPLLVNKVDAILCRRIGVGCHGLADALAALGLRYDTSEAINMTDKIYTILANTVYDESVTLGQEKGIFQIFDWELEKNNPFINRLYPEVIERIKTLGRRNIACLTNAPTGTLSIISRNCSSGIEPVFKLKYLRNVKIQNSEETTQHIVYHQAAQDCLAAGGDLSVFVEANNIDWKNRVKLQAVIQKNIDHSISSTVNLPEGTSFDIISNIYLTAWKAGLKGITTYIEGCRTGVLVSADTKEAKRSYPIERPKTTDIDIFKTKYKEKNYMILVGKVDGKPIECFGGLEDGLSLPTTYKSASLTKKSRGHYSLTVQLSEDEEDVLKVNNVGARFPAQDIMTLTRMISLAFRNGISVADVVEQLAKATTALYDAPAVFARVLKQYISDDDLITRERTKGKTCPDCETELDFKRESGCLTEICPKCNYSNSKCS